MWFLLTLLLLPCTGLFPVTLPQFLMMSPENKAQSFSTLSDEDKKFMLAGNMRLLNENKICPGCYFENTLFENRDFSGAILSSCVMKNCVFRNCKFNKAFLDGAYIIDGEITNCDFTELNPGITSQNAVGMMIAGITRSVVINDCKFIKANLHRSLINADFKKCDLTEVQAVSARLRDTRFDEFCSLVRANLQWLDVYYMLFSGNMTQADFRNAMLLEFDARNALCTQANFQDATIIYSRFNGAKMDGVNLQGTNFVYGVSLRFVNLAKAAVSPTTNFGGAYFCQTIMPDGGLNPDNEAATKSCERNAANAHTREGSSLEIVKGECLRSALDRKQARPCTDGIMDIVAFNRDRLIKTKQCPYCMLEGVDLRGQNLTDADLRGAWLRNANLRGANFTNAKLERARFPGAMTDANTKFTGATLCHTLMPDKGSATPYGPGQNWREDNCAP